MVWSLYKKTSNEQSDIFDSKGELLEPLKFSNGKTQEDVVNETMSAIERGEKIIFIHGVCGTGKSAIALNIAKNFKRSAIVVPIKNLQEQYEMDYTKKMFVLKDNKKPLNISVIKGRGNFKCPFMNTDANDKTLPCIIEIRDKNLPELLKYIDDNPLTKREDFENVTDIKRMNIAPSCPYWSPIMPADIKPRGIVDFKKFKFNTVSGKEFALFRRKAGCGYCDQYINYNESDCLIFNSAKYLIELDMERKPETDIEIIDECDEFLDNFANEKRININRLISSLSNLHPKEQKHKVAVKDLIYELNSFLFTTKEIEIQKLDSSIFYKTLKKILNLPHLAEDEEFSYYNTVFEIAKNFESTMKQTYISADLLKQDEQSRLYGNNDGTLFVNLVSINLEQKMRDLIEKNKVLVFMSGTLHSKQVLKNIFGIKDFTLIEAETKMPGEIKKSRIGIEKNCTYANFKSGNITRKQYLKILDCTVANSLKPTLIHVNSFGDLPSQKEKDEFMIENLMTREELHLEQKLGNKPIQDFINKRKDVLFTTRCNRGIDFADEKCRSIILTRYPYPNISGLFWKILKKEHPDKFMQFYMDKANRELIQKIARGVRNEDDWIELYSPDLRVLNG